MPVQSVTPKKARSGRRTPHHEPTFDLSDEARTLFVNLQDTLREAVPTNRDGSQLTATQLGEVLELNTKLSWKIARLIDASDPLAAAPFVPGKAGLEIMFAALARHGTPKAKLRAVQDVLDQYHAFIGVHAGTRQAFDSMIASYTQEYRQRIDIDHRKMAFQGNSYLLGVQARTLLSTFIILPPRGEGPPLRVASLSAAFELRRLRQQVPFRMTRLLAMQAPGAQRTLERQPLDDAEHDHPFGDKLPLIPRFCSQPLPGSRVVEREQGIYELEFVDGAVGNTGVVTCVTGEVAQYPEGDQGGNVPRYFFRMLRTPAEVAVMDVFVHKDIADDIDDPDVSLISEVNDALVGVSPHEADHLPFFETVQRVGTDRRSASIETIPNYHEILTWTFDRLRVPTKVMRGFRVQMKFPPVPAYLQLELTK